MIIIFVIFLTLHKFYTRDFSITVLVLDINNFILFRIGQNHFFGRLFSNLYISQSTQLFYGFYHHVYFPTYVLHYSSDNHPELVKVFCWHLNSYKKTATHNTKMDVKRWWLLHSFFTCNHQIQKFCSWLWVQNLDLFQEL